MSSVSRPTAHADSPVLAQGLLSVPQLTSEINLSILNHACVNVCDGSKVFSICLDKEQHWHIKCLEIMAVFLALSTFLPDVKEHHVLVH